MSYYLSSQFIITMDNIPTERNLLPISNYGFVPFNLFIVDITLSRISDGINFTMINQKSLFYTVDISNSVLDPPRQYNELLHLVKDSAQVFRPLFLFRYFRSYSIFSQLLRFVQRTKRRVTFHEKNISTPLL